jgi:hypothetical protein
MIFISFLQLMKHIAIVSSAQALDLVPGESQLKPAEQSFLFDDPSHLDLPGGPYTPDHSEISLSPEIFDPSVIDVGDGFTLDESFASSDCSSDDVQLFDKREGPTRYCPNHRPDVEIRPLGITKDPPLVPVFPNLELCPSYIYGEFRYAACDSGVESHRHLWILPDIHFLDECTPCTFNRLILSALAVFKSARSREPRSSYDYFMHRRHCRRLL